MGTTRHYNTKPEISDHSIWGSELQAPPGGNHGYPTLDVTAIPAHHRLGEELVKVQKVSGRSPRNLYTKIKPIKMAASEGQ